MILVLGGTSDSIHICNKLNDMGLPYIVSVTTEYGRDIAKKATENVFLGKLTKEDMVSLIKEKNITQIIDATHPMLLLYLVMQLNVLKLQILIM